jgi:hypothetical protein
MGGDRLVLIEKFETQISLKFHRDYANGITGFVHDYEDAFVELDSLNVPHDVARWLTLLLGNLLIPDDNEWMVAHCENAFPQDFIGACGWLKSQDAKRTLYESNTSKRKAHNTTHDAPIPHIPQESIAVEHLAFYISQLSQPVLAHKLLDAMHIVLLTQNDSHYIAPALWGQLLQTSIQDILCAKLNLPRRDGGDGWESKQREIPKPKEKPKPLSMSEQLDSSAPPSSLGTPLGKQYNHPEAKANLAQKAAAAAEERGLDENSEASDTESIGDPETYSDFEQLKKAFLASRHVNVLMTVASDEQRPYPTIQANLNYLDRMACLSKGDDSCFYSVTDNGADTTVMGDGWLILGDIETAPRANLVGFDKDAKKKGLPIISGAIKLITSAGEAIILCVHQGVYNAGSRTTLISEFQVREHVQYATFQEKEA